MSPCPVTGKMTGTAHYDPSIGASATTRLNRKDFGIAWSRLMDGGGVVVADEVDIILDVELVKKQPPKQTSSLQ